MNFDGLFGKYEMEDVAKRIILECEKLNTWNVAFQVPDMDDDTGLHVGFTWLIMDQYLVPVPSLSYMWVINKSFLEKVKTRYISDSLESNLGENHGLRPLHNYPLTGKLPKGHYPYGS